MEMRLRQCDSGAIQVSVFFLLLFKTDFANKKIKKIMKKQEIEKREGKKKEIKSTFTFLLLFCFCDCLMSVKNTKKIENGFYRRVHTRSISIFCLFLPCFFAFSFLLLFCFFLLCFFLCFACFDLFAGGVRRACRGGGVRWPMVKRLVPCEVANGKEAGG